MELDTFTVVRLGEDGKVVERVETCFSARSAIRAQTIFMAHEKMNGRQTRYDIEPAVDRAEVPLHTLHLPRWALKALELTAS